MLLNVYGHPGGFVFFEVDYQKRGLNFPWCGRYDLHRNYGMVAILSFLCNYDNLTLKLNQEKQSYSHERYLFIGIFKVGSVPGRSAALVAS